MTIEQIVLGGFGAAIAINAWFLRGMIETMRKNDREHYEQQARETNERVKAVHELEIRMLHLIYTRTSK